MPESRQFPRPFNIYLNEINILLTGISIEQRKEIRQELLAHLEDAAEEQGLSPDDPALQMRVIATLGSSLALGNSLYDAHQGEQTMLKRILDILLATLFLVLCSPLFLVFSILIKLNSPGPIFYKDLRIGRNGRNYHLYKFRSMTATMPLQLTRIGHFMRNHNIDELPQFWNVVKGEMSLVGPRPSKPLDMELDNPGWQRVLKTRPGLASPAFVCTTSMGDNPQSQLEENLHYLEKQSLRYDLQLLGRTLGVLRTHAGTRT